MLLPQQLALHSYGVQFDFVLRISASMPIGGQRMEDVKRIDEANETHAVTLQVETCNSNYKW